MFHVERTPGTEWMRRCQTGRPSRVLTVGIDQVDLTGQRKRVNESWVGWHACVPLVLRPCCPDGRVILDGTRNLRTAIRDGLVPVSRFA